jgi:hypothetical protein
MLGEIYPRRSEMHKHKGKICAGSGLKGFRNSVRFLPPLDGCKGDALLMTVNLWKSDCKAVGAIEYTLPVVDLH